MLLRAAAVVVDALDRLPTAAASKRTRKVVRPGRGGKQEMPHALPARAGSTSRLFRILQQVAISLLEHAAGIRSRPSALLYSPNVKHDTPRIGCGCAACRPL